MKIRRWMLAAFPLLVLASFMIAGCGGGGSSSGGESDDDLSDLVLIDVNVGGADGVALNQVIEQLGCPLIATGFDVGDPGLVQGLRTSRLDIDTRLVLSD